MNSTTSIPQSQSSPCIWVNGWAGTGDPDSSLGIPVSRAFCFIFLFSPSFHARGYSTFELKYSNGLPSFLLPHLLEVSPSHSPSETKFGCALVVHFCLVIVMLFPGVGEDLVGSSAPGPAGVSQEKKSWTRMGNNQGWLNPRPL